MLSSTAPAIRESSLWFIWAKVGQRQVAADSQAKLQTWPLSPPVGCYRPNIRPLPLVLLLNRRLILIYRPSEGGSWVDLSTAVSVQPVPKAAYRTDFRENTNFCPQRNSNLGSLVQQASVLPLDHCDILPKLHEGCLPWIRHIGFNWLRLYNSNFPVNAWQRLAFFCLVQGICRRRRCYTSTYIFSTFSITQQCIEMNFYRSLIQIIGDKRPGHTKSDTVYELVASHTLYMFASKPLWGRSKLTSLQIWPSAKTALWFVFLQNALHTN